MSRGRLVMRGLLGKIGFLLLFGLLACAGSSTDGGSGVGSPVSGIGGNPVGGGPLGGGNQAAPTISAPAPDAVAWDPVTDFFALFITCKNIAGPQVDCHGDKYSAPGKSQLRLIVHPADNMDQIKGSPLLVDTQVNGAWVGLVTADAGDVVEICLVKDSGCLESLFLTAPPLNGEVNGTQGILRNFVNQNGSNYFSEVKPQPKHEWSWTSLFISEAHADDTPFLPSGFYNNFIGRFTDVFRPAGGTGTTGGGPVAPAEPTPPAPRIMSPDCGEGFTFRVMEADEERAPRLAGNFAGIYRYNPDMDPFFETVVQIPNATRDEIKDLAAVDMPTPDGSVRVPYLAAAVRNRVYMVNMAATQPYIEYRFDFPNDTQVTQLIESRSEIYALITSPTGAPIEHTLYRLGHRFVPGHGYQELLSAVCVPRVEALQNVKEITQIDIDENEDKFVAVVKGGDGKYRVVAGSPVLYSDLTDFPPVAIKTFDYPVQAQILGLDDFGITLVILDPRAKTLQTIQYNWATEVPSAADLDRSFPPKSLASDYHISGLNHPRLFTVNREKQRMAFLDIKEEGSRIVTLGYSGRGHEYTVPLASIVFNIGTDTPNYLHILDDGVGYNDGFNAQIRKAQTVMERFNWDDATMSPLPDSVRGAIIDGPGLPAGTRPIIGAPEED